MAHPLAGFHGRWFACLETYTRAGRAVRTPLFFVLDQGVLYMRTAEGTAKLGRLRRQARARVAPCTLWGAPAGPWVEVETDLLEATAAEWVDRLSLRKYGLARRLIDLRTRLAGLHMVVIAARPLAPHS